MGSGKMTRLSITALAAGLFCVFVFAAPALAAKKKPVVNGCTKCHEKVSPQIVKDWFDCKMSPLFACDKCHGDAHKTATDFAKAVMPTADTCKPCHGKQVEQFSKGKHAVAWVAMEAMPKTAAQPHQIMEGMKGCGGCHRIGYQGGKCDSCHTRHKFSKAEAQHPAACDTCHMNEGDHGVMTSWGFLALRLPEDDAEWMADRVTILQALNVLDEKGQPTGRLDVVEAGKVARLTKEEWQAPRDRMIKVCSNCHAEAYAKD